VEVLESRTLLSLAFAIDDFSQSADLTLNGAAHPVMRVLNLVPDRASQKGSVFYNTPFATNRPFHTYFEFSIPKGNSSPAEGLAFILHNDPRGTQALGDGGANLGYGAPSKSHGVAISHSVAIAFDVHGSTTKGRKDMDGNRVALLSNGDAGRPLAQAVPNFTLAGSTGNVWIDYDPSARKLEVFVDRGAHKPAKPLLSHKIALDTVVGTKAYAGFGAATGDQHAAFDIRNWEFIDTPPTLIFSGYPSPTTAGQAQAFTVTAEDGLGNVLSNYLGKVHFTSTDPHAVLPSDYTFTSRDRGSHTFRATLKTAGRQSVSATDTKLPDIQGMQTAILVNDSVPSSTHVPTVPRPRTDANGDEGAPAVAPAPNLPPTINSVSPQAAQEGSDAIGLILRGSHFVKTSLVQWNGKPLATDVVSEAQLRATVPAASLLEEGQFALTVVNPTPGGSTSGERLFTVTDAPLKAGKATLKPAQGTPFTEVVASITDLNPYGRLADFKSTIDWGDGTREAGAMQAVGRGFEVTGSHTYVEDKTFTILVTILDAGGGQTTVKSSAIVLTAKQVEKLQDTAVQSGEEGQAAVTVGTKGIMATLVRSETTHSTPEVFVARYTGNTEKSASNGVVFYDTRVTNAAENDTLQVSYEYPDTVTSTPALEFFDPSKKTFITVHGSTQLPGSLSIDQKRHIITVIFDKTSVPALADLQGTVFTVAVAPPQPEPTPAASDASCSRPTPTNLVGSPSRGVADQPVERPAGATADQLVTRSVGAAGQPVAPAPSLSLTGETRTTAVTITPVVALALANGNANISNDSASTSFRTTTTFLRSGQLALTLTPSSDSHATVSRTVLSSGASPAISATETVSLEDYYTFWRRALGEELFWGLWLRMDRPLSVPVAAPVQPAAETVGPSRREAVELLFKETSQTEQLPADFEVDAPQEGMDEVWAAPLFEMEAINPYWALAATIIGISYQPFRAGSFTPGSYTSVGRVWRAAGPRVPGRRDIHEEPSDWAT
jgi:hypothetical protein